MSGMCIPLHWFLVIVSFWNPVAFMIIYGIALKYNHISSSLPIISTLGASPPESCWFSLFTNISTFLCIFSGYIRHTQIQEFSKCCPNNGPSFWSNSLASAIGLISTFGLLILANFTYDLKVNDIGAHVAIACFIIYFIIQTVFSFYMAPKLNSWFIFGLRILLCVGAVIVNIARLVFYYQAQICNTVLARSLDGEVWCTRHAIAVWTLVFLFSIMSLTFIPEFKRIKLETPVIKMKRSWEESS